MSDILSGFLTLAYPLVLQVPTFVCGRSVHQIPREQLVHYPIAVCANPHSVGGYRKKKRRRMDGPVGGKEPKKSSKRRMSTKESVLDVIFINEDTTTPKIPKE